ncbi:MAG TPA: cobalamin-binding protein [Thermodesulfobacteriota bacterium]|nr:cobalamin-binding protein [Thermodesulfobacteriota bacterium]
MKRYLQIYLIFLTLVPFGFSYSSSRPFPERIISLSPNITEIIYGLGAMEKVVGVTLYSDFPPEVEGLPKVGGWIDPNLEAILELKPDLVIMIEDQNEIFGDKIRKLGLNTLSVDCNGSIKDIADSIEQIGRALGKEAEAKKLAEDMDSDLEEIRTKTKNITPKRLLFVVGRNPGTLEDIYVIGRTGFMNEMITIAGGENVIDSDRLAVKVSREAILKLNPEVIIEINHEKLDKKDKVLAEWGELKRVSAVSNKEIYSVSSTVLLHPSQRVVEGTRILARILHPEIFDRYGRINIHH